MSELNNLIDKYLNAESSLSEEEQIFEDSYFRLWGEFIKQNKIIPSENLSDKLWDSFEETTKTKPKKLFKLSLISIAASIALIITLVFTHKEKEMSNAEKEALLKEALTMVQDDQNIIYSDDIITITYE